MHRERVRGEWIDYNGHMNVAYYVLVFDHATDGLLEELGLGEAYRERTGNTVYVLETHVSYERELREGDPLRVESRVLDCDAKRLHCFHRMFHERERFLAATSELLLIHIDGASGRSAAMPEAAQRRAEALRAAAGDEPPPPQVGRAIGIRRPGGAGGPP